MCGIVGFTGNRQAAPILLDGLSKLEYRGYDSAGLAVRDGDAMAQVVKAKGRLSNLVEKTDNGNALKGTCGIGHTRWATHGEPSQINAHPHVSVTYRKPVAKKTIRKTTPSMTMWAGSTVEEIVQDDNREQIPFDNPHVGDLAKPI